jgi:hypothetical protein
LLDSAGIRPIAVVESAMINMEMIRLDFLPNLSPKCPKKIAPSGRIMYPDAKTKKVEIIELRWLVLGKNR